MNENTLDRVLYNTVARDDERGHVTAIGKVARSIARPAGFLRDQAQSGPRYVAAQLLQLAG